MIRIVPALAAWLVMTGCDCPAGKKSCPVDVPGGGSRCVDTANDDSNCGSCLNKCALGSQICVNGKCIDCKVPTCNPPFVFDRKSCSCVCSTKMCGPDGSCCNSTDDLCCADGECCPGGFPGGTCCLGRCCAGG